MYAMQPGDTITPGGQATEPQGQPQQPQPAIQQAPPQPVPNPGSLPTPTTFAAEVPQEPPQAALQTPATPSDLPQQMETAQGQPIDTPEPESSWEFSGDDGGTEPQGLPQTPVSVVSWTASEYIAHDKNISWYLSVIAAAVVVAVVVYFLTKDFVSPAVVVVIGVAFAVFGARKPQVLQYSVSNVGVQIGQKQYPFGMFRTFSVLEEDATRSILLMPLQRFNLPISIYYDPADEQQIVAALASHLPHEERSIGQIDNFMRKIRF